MGLAMVERVLEKGHSVNAYDINNQARNQAQLAGATTAHDFETLFANNDNRDLVWIMVPHQFVEDVLNDIRPFLKAGDVVIEGGNSPYKDSARRAQELAAMDVKMLDVGVSGGPGGARNGACMMIGGDKGVYDGLVSLWQDLCVPEGFGYVGKSGGGHFVKMVHNGIEYGMMQAIGEGFGIMKKSEFDLDLTEITKIYNNGSVIESSLIGWLQDGYAQYGEDLNDISGEVSHSGEGQWTVDAAKDLNVPVDIIEESLQFRKDSQGNPTYVGQVVSVLRNMFGGHSVEKK